eukprot:355158-Chlamydomonas_euryale.AAC.5
MGAHPFGPACMLPRSLPLPSVLPRPRPRPSPTPSFPTAAVAACGLLRQSRILGYARRMCVRDEGREEGGREGALTVGRSCVPPTQKKPPATRIRSRRSYIVKGSETHPQCLRRGIVGDALVSRRNVPPLPSPGRPLRPARTELQTGARQVRDKACGEA